MEKRSLYLVALNYKRALSVLSNHPDYKNLNKDNIAFAYNTLTHIFKITGHLYLPSNYYKAFIAACKYIYSGDYSLITESLIKSIVDIIKDHDNLSGKQVFLLFKLYDKEVFESYDVKGKFAEYVNSNIDDAIIKLYEFVKLKKNENLLSSDKNKNF